jgi:hypothetical protein
MRVKIGEKYWKMVFTPVPDADGNCDPPTARNKHIRLPPRLKKDPKRLMEVVVHEMLHGSDWTKDESWVETTAEDIARVLWRLGYRRSEPKEL